MDAKERYFWDLTGHLVVPQVLSPDEVAEANEAIDYYTREILKIQDSDDLPGRPDVQANTVVRTSNQHPYFLKMPPPYSDPFRKMLVHPQVVSRLNKMCGRGFRLDHGPELIGHVKGVEGLRLHGSGNRHKPYVAYRNQNGEMYCGGVTVSWQLSDVGAGDGGFVAVPGSHKSKYVMPEDLKYFKSDMEVLVQPAMKAGDILFFMDGAQTHGTLPWQAEHQRRSILYKYTSRTSTRQGTAEEFAPPENYWDQSITDGMTPEQLAVMWGPYANYHEELPVLGIDDRGTVHTEEPIDAHNIWSDRRG